MVLADGGWFFGNISVVSRLATMWLLEYRYGFNDFVFWLSLTMSRQHSRAYLWFAKYHSVGLPDARRSDMWSALGRLVRTELVVKCSIQSCVSSLCPGLIASPRSFPPPWTSCHCSLSHFVTHFVVFLAVLVPDSSCYPHYPLIISPIPLSILLSVTSFIILSATSSILSFASSIKSTGLSDFL